MKEQETGLPEGWELTTMEKISTVISGGTPNAKVPDNFTEPKTGIAWITPADLSKYNKKYISNGARDLTEQGYKSCSARLMPKGAVLLSSRAPIGYLAIAENDICTNQGFKSFVLNANVDSEYTYFYLKYIRDFIESLGSGTTFKELSASGAKKIPFPLPPLPEQQHLSQKLTALLDGVAEAKQRLEKIPALLKQFRQSVLADAVSGKLTEEWRKENEEVCKNYRELCISEREKLSGKKVKKLSKLEQFPAIELPDSWSWNAIDEICLKITDGTHHSPENKESGDYMYVTSKNVREGYIDLSNITYVDEKTHKEIFARCDVAFGDVLYVKDGANTGLACVNNIREEVSLLSSVGVLKQCSFIEPYYLQHYLNSPTGRKLMLDLMSGTAIKRLTLTKIASSPIPVPPKAEQTQIIQKVETYFALADKIETEAASALEKVNLLTQSILAKAFRGELSADWRAENNIA